jgi:hypothetical protein
MDLSNLELTPELRNALLAQPDSPVYISDRETQRVYVLFEKGKFPGLEESYIQDALERAREQIASGEVSTASVPEIIARAQKKSAT